MSASLPFKPGAGRAFSVAELLCVLAITGIIAAIAVPRFASSIGQRRAEMTAQRIAANGPLATKGAKRIIAARQEPGFRAARELSDALRHALEWSHDVDEGMAAHRENRRPTFRGR